MTEFELKLEIPPARLASVEAALRRGMTRTQRLRARYFDTADRALAAQGVVLRLRKEGRHWVQTAKAPGSRPLERLEHNVVLGSQTAPLPDLSRHDGTPVGERLRQALQHQPDAASPDLTLVYQTDMVRLTRIVRARGALVELALDQGHITAGDRTLPVRELELELKQGQAAGAVALATTWCLRHGLWLSSVSKSLKGQRLALGQDFGAAVGAETPRFPRPASGREVAAAVVATCLNQVLANASDVAAGCSAEEHIHQLRVGLRRLRTALQQLEALAGGWGDQGDAWKASLARVFRALGQHRDRDYLLGKLQGQIEAAGGPPLDWQETLGALPSAAESVRSPAFQQALLGLIGFVHAVPDEGKSAPDDTSATSPKKFLRKRLAKLHKQVLAQGRQFTALPEAEQHALRKRLKRLRYLAEFAQPLFARRKAAAYLAALKPLQDALGIYHDEVAALLVWQGLSGHDPRALFGAGWLSARREVHVQACQQACDLLARQARPFWD
ncbi:MAG: CHAD domain-containing protein [Polaromonas sp.]|uniref:CYTH and CHAD domain-containing protein n=1 Tax=Polaromonas sp. TaxID=1869339 RepID=UPI0027303D84|nr:CYTH and CHAD domain-containing protein [Polaromonas sp.]MDP2448194.1 CHAD domain-containing protein [Polaromonas sp.]MDP3249222.1 CHAD domain-containing protein [Polaromonas sp.]MDP3754023.1 CHAD domain-containing protein [Polaromonas sp.]